MYVIKNKAQIRTIGITILYLLTGGAVNMAVDLVREITMDLAMSQSTDTYVIVGFFLLIFKYFIWFLILYFIIKLWNRTDPPQAEITNSPKSNEQINKLTNWRIIVYGFPLFLISIFLCWALLGYFFTGSL